MVCRYEMLSSIRFLTASNAITCAYLRRKIRFQKLLHEAKQKARTFVIANDKFLNKCIISQHFR